MDKGIQIMTMRKSDFLKGLVISNMTFLESFHLSNRLT